ncbi:MAG: hypothetical protein V8S95_01725 [Odoribacter sp.]
MVDYKLGNSIGAAVIELVMWHPGRQQPFNEQRNEELIRYLLTVDHVAAPAALARLYTAAYVRKGDFRGMLDKMRGVSSNLFRDGSERFYFQSNVEALAR